MSYSKGTIFDLCTTVRNLSAYQFGIEERIALFSMFVIAKVTSLVGPYCKLPPALFFCFSQTPFNYT